MFDCITGAHKRIRSIVDIRSHGVVVCESGRWWRQRRIAFNTGVVAAHSGKESVIFRSGVVDRRTCGKRSVCCEQVRPDERKKRKRNENLDDVYSNKTYTHITRNHSYIGHWQCCLDREDLMVQTRAPCRTLVLRTNLCDETKA